MPKKQPTRRSATPRGGSADSPVDDGTAAAVDELSQAVAGDHPLPLLALASSMLNALDQRNGNPFAAPPEPRGLPPLAELLPALADSGPATAALAWTTGHLHDDDLLRARVVRGLGPRSTALPAWLQRIDEVEVVGAQQTATSWSTASSSWSTCGSPAST